jgi:hypothetical protein
MTARATVWFAVVPLAAASLAACTVTETGNPVAPIASARITVTVTGSETLEVRGVEGAIHPGGGSVVLVNLDRSGAPITAAVDDSGAFVADVMGVVGDVIRVERPATGDWSSVDLTTEDGVATSVVAPAVPCLEVAVDGTSAGDVLALGNVSADVALIATLSLTNGCPDAVGVESIASDMVDVAVTVTSSGLPADLPPEAGLPGAAEVRVLRAVATSVHEVVRIELADGSSRVISVVAEVGVSCWTLDEAGCAERPECMWVTEPGFPGPISSCMPR